MTRHATEDDLIMDLIKTNRKTSGETMSQKQYQRHGDHNPWQAANKFGSWNKAKAAAGVYKKNPDQTRITDKQLLEDLKKINDNTESVTVQNYRKKGKYSVSLIYNRFESFPAARRKAYKT